VRWYELSGETESPLPTAKEDEVDVNEIELKIAATQNNISVNKQPLSTI